MGGPWCCWPFLCVVIFVIVATVGITLIQTLESCSTDTYDNDRNTSQSSCTEYEAVYAVGVGILILCCCCFLIRPREGEYQAQDGSLGERQPMLASEAPPPAAAYASTADAPPKPPTAEYQTKGKVYGRT
ncbi:unnamed protein product [Laminaria digitata]